MPFHGDCSGCRQVAGVSAGRRKSFPACWMPCPSPLPVTVTRTHGAAHRVSPLSCCGRCVHQSSAEPCREWQACQVHSSVLAATLPGSCVAEAAFGSGLGGCASGWDSGRLLGAQLLPLAPLQVCMGLSHADLSQAPLAPVPLARMGPSQAVWSLPHWAL